MNAWKSYMKKIDIFYWFSLTFPGKMAFFQANMKFDDFSRQEWNSLIFQACMNHVAEWPWRYRSRSKVVARDTLMLVIICAKYRKNPSTTVCAIEWTQDATYFSSFIAKSWMNDLEDICQGQQSLCATHPLMLVIISAKYGKNPSRTVGVTEQTRNVERMDKRIETNTSPRTTTSLCGCIDTTPLRVEPCSGLWVTGADCAHYSVSLIYRGWWGPSNGTAI